VVAHGIGEVQEAWPTAGAGDERILVVGKARFDVDDVGDGAATISKAVGKKNGDGLSRP
jgi:hypothetical protein